MAEGAQAGWAWRPRKGPVSPQNRAVRKPGGSASVSPDAARRQRPQKAGTRRPPPITRVAAAASIQAGTEHPLRIRPTARLNVLYADWEFSPEEHRDRLERLCGRDIGFIVIDSVAAVCDGPPEAAEVAMAEGELFTRFPVNGVYKVALVDSVHEVAA